MTSSRSVALVPLRRRALPMDIVFTVFDERYVWRTGTLSARCAIAVDCRAWIRFCCEFDFAACTATFDLR